MPEPVRHKGNLFRDYATIPRVWKALPLDSRFHGFLLPPLSTSWPFSSSEAFKDQLNPENYGSNGYFNLCLDRQIFFNHEPYKGTQPPTSRSEPLEPDEIRWIEQSCDKHEEFFFNYLRNYAPVKAPTKNNVHKGKNYRDTYKIPYPVVPPRSTHSLIGAIQGAPQEKEYPGLALYADNMVNGLDAQTWNGCKMNYVRFWKHHKDEQKLSQYVDADWA